MTPDLHHFYHVYADGNWAQPVTDHCEALVRYGLAAELASVHVGYVGTPDNIAAAHCTIEHYLPGYQRCAESPAGWEQETLDPLHKFVKSHNGLVSYAHTKGAANYNPINDGWRRDMEYHNYVQWREPVEALLSGCSIAGAHWYQGGPSSVPGFGHGGMFGGNYWWTRCDLLRQNVPPGRYSRFEAEHWLGQLSEVMPITGDTICDLNPTRVDDQQFHTTW